MVGREGVEGEQVLLGLFQQRRHLGQRLPQPLERIAEQFARRLALSALKNGRSGAASIGCCSRRACPSASRKNCTVQRCQGQGRRTPSRSPS
jgi:hypothetical protein